MRSRIGRILMIASVALPAAPANAQLGVPLSCEAFVEGAAGRVIASYDIDPRVGDVIERRIHWVPPIRDVVQSTYFGPPTLSLHYAMQADGTSGHLIRTRIHGLKFQNPPDATPGAQLPANRDVRVRVSTPSGSQRFFAMSMEGNLASDREGAALVSAEQPSSIRVEYVHEAGEVLAGATFDLSVQALVPAMAREAKVEGDRRVGLYQDKIRNNGGQPDPFLCPK